MSLEFSPPLLPHLRQTAPFLFDIASLIVPSGHVSTEFSVGTFVILITSHHFQLITYCILRFRPFLHLLRFPALFLPYYFA